MQAASCNKADLHRTSTQRLTPFVCIQTVFISPFTLIMQCFALLTLFLSTLASSVDAYAFSSPASVGATSRMAFRPSTCLRAESDSDDSGSDILNSPAFLTRKLEVLKSDLATAEESMAAATKKLEDGKAEWEKQFEDLKKEYQNIQDRMASQSEKGDSQATIDVVRTMLGVLDNCDRAFGSVTAETEAEKAIEAEYKETYDMILSNFEKLGVEAVPTVGTEFDYELHQAVMQRPFEGIEEGFVGEELQKGFKLGDVLVRAAMVAVAA